MTALDGLIGGIRQIYLAGVEATFKRALDFTDMAGEILSDRIRLTVSGLRGVAVADTAPTAGDVLTYDGSEWTPSALALCTTTADYTQPAVGVTVDIAVTTTTAMATGQTVLVEAGGYYAINTVLSTTALRLELLAAIAAPAATVSSGASVLTSGIPTLPASDVTVDASGFAGVLSGTDTDVQTALETIDAIVPGALSVGATLFVDAVNGNDTSGTRGRADLPYLTIGAAVAAASSGDVVQVGPGAFTESITLKNIAELTLRGSGTHATKLTGALTTDVITRTSSTALTALTIECMSIATNGEAECIVLNGASVATPGYAVGATDKGIILRDLVLAAPTTALLLTCLGKLRMQDVKITSGAATLYEIGSGELRNFDTSSGAFTANFRVAQTLPNGYTYGTAKIYSNKLGATTIAGYTFATIDSSSRGEALAYTPDDGGVLELGSCRFGALTVTYTDGGAVESYGAWFEGNSSIAAGEHNFYGGGVVGAFTTTGTGETHGYNFMVTGSIVAGVSHHVTIHYPDGTSTEYPAI